MASVSKQIKVMHWNVLSEVKKQFNLGKMYWQHDITQTLRYGAGIQTGINLTPIIEEWISHETG